MNWDQSFKEYAVQIAGIYKNNPAEIVNCLGFASVSGCLNETYLSLVKTKELDPIEKLDNSVKEELWNQAKELTTSKKQGIEIARSIYLLNALTK